jgi:D-glycerate 3-kinase
MEHQSELSLLQLLAAGATGESLPLSVWEQLEAEALADELRAKAFAIAPSNIKDAIRTRSHLLVSIYPDLLQFCQTTGIQWHSYLLETLWNLWLPLALQLAAGRQQMERPLIQGILGGQGTGKTTMAAVLTLVLAHLGYRTLSISLDDLYKTYNERLALKQQDPRLIRRGPPGTHDIDLGIAVLDQLRQPPEDSHYPPNPKSILVPRFDKSAWGGEGDRTQPEIVQNIDIVLFEGWFVGVRPIDPAAFDRAPPPIITEADRAFARDMNAKLQDYLPLWDRLDQLMVLHPVDYRLSQRWRREAEQKMIAAGKSGMTDETVNQFVEYFWKSIHPELFIAPMVRNPNWVDLVIEIDGNHSPGLVYQPSDRLP